MAAFLLYFPAAVLSQSEISGGHLRGRVLDPTGAVLPGATITVKNLDTSIERQVTSDDVGEYRILRLPPGTYSVMASTKETWTITENGKETVFGYMPTYFPGVSKGSRHAA